MKKTVIMFLFSLLCLCFVTAQSKINGVGIFKINQTKLDVIDSLSRSGYSLVECDNPSRCTVGGTTSSKIIYELKKQPIYVVYYPLIDNMQVFVLSKYAIADFEIKKLYLNFYNGTLYKIQTDDLYPLVEKLELKYENTLKTNTNTITCSSIYGEFTREEKSFITTFRKDEIEAYSFLEARYDSKCKENYLGFFVIFDKKIIEIVGEKEKAAKEQIKKKEETEIQNKLKDL